MKLSVVMPCYNRLAFLRNTLWSFTHNIKNIDYEVIVVDDVSDYEARAHHAYEEFKDKMDLKIVLRTKKVSRNAGIPFNQAASLAKGDYLMITGPDFMLMDSISDAMASIEANPEQMIAAATYANSKNDQSSLEKFDLSNPKSFNEYKSTLKFLPKGILKEGEEGWYCHSQHRPYGLGTPWLLLKDIFDDLGGFDKAYYRYFGFEDTDFLNRIQQKQIPININDDLLYIHQYHYNSGDKEDTANRETGYKFNRQIYDRKFAGSA